jgi:hypothetical protein
MGSAPSEAPRSPSADQALATADPTAAATAGQAEEPVAVTRPEPEEARGSYRHRAS